MSSDAAAAAAAARAARAAVIKQKLNMREERRKTYPSLDELCQISECGSFETIVNYLAVEIAYDLLDIDFSRGEIFEEGYFSVPGVESLFTYDEIRVLAFDSCSDVQKLANEIASL